MTTIPEALALALLYHRSGDLQQAEAIYRQVLQADPQQADAHHLLGVIAYQEGNSDLAIQHISRSIQLQPAHASAYCNLGMVLASLRRWAEAAEQCRQALRLKPDFAEAYSRLGGILQAQGQLVQAEEQFRQALRLQPELAEVYNNLGNVLKAQGRFAAAAESYRQAVSYKPDLTEAYNNLGHALRALDRLTEAAEQFRQALRLKPGFAAALSGLGLVLANLDQFHEAENILQQAVQAGPDLAEAHNNLGLTLMKMRRYEEAVASLRQAQRLDPGAVEVCNNLGIALAELDRFDEAVASLRQALTLASQSAGPEYAAEPETDPAAKSPGPHYLQTHFISLPEIYNNLGMVLTTEGRFDDALRHLEEALRLQPDFAEPHFSRALIHLHRGDFEGGWAECEEWRWQCKRFVPRPFPQPRWDGSPLAGRIILLHAEQGLGDTIQFIRYAPLVKERGGRVIVECQQELLGLLATCPGIDRLVPAGSALPPFDVYAALVSLPAILRTTLETIPANVPYLFADPQRVSGKWLVVSGEEGRDHSPLTTHHSPLKIGIAWQGNPNHMNDRRRSVPLAGFVPLARIDGVRLFSLQKGFGIEQLGRIDSEFAITDLGSRLESFMDTAAVMSNLDLVITIDSALAHCAGALGVPVWGLLPFVPDWRWLLNRADSPWYPTMRLFRQQRRGDWEEVFQRIAQEVRDQKPRYDS